MKKIFLFIILIFSIYQIIFAEVQVYKIKMRTITIDTRAPNLNIPPDLKFNDSELKGENIFIAHIRGKKVKKGIPELIESKKIQILGYLPYNSFIIRSDVSKNKELLKDKIADWIGPFEPYYKIHPELYKFDGKEGSIKLFVLLFPGAKPDRVSEVFKYSTIKMINYVQNPHNGKFVVETLKEDLRENLALIAHIKDVWWIEEYPDYELMNDRTAWICQSGLHQNQATPLYDNGIYGEGQLVAVLDTGVDADMCYFYDFSYGLPTNELNLNQRKIVCYRGPDNFTRFWDNQGHGTHVACTIAGDNFITPGLRDEEDGIAVRAKLIIYDYGNDYDIYVPDDLYSLIVDSYDLGARIHSDSWGAPMNLGEYTIHTMEVDQVMWDYKDFIINFAAGNEGSSEGVITPPGTAKNVITVGATEPGYMAENMAYFSSHGPTLDGRRKPTLAICGGFYIHSAESDSDINTFNCSTTEMAGTSMATAASSACCALVRDYFLQGFYPLGYPNSYFSFEPSSALIKATIINSCDNMQGAYTADVGDGHADIPSFGQGWGRIHLDNSLYFQGDDRKLFIDDNREGIHTDDEVSYNIIITDNQVPLRITLVWTDIYSNPSASINLVNDLDLEVIYNNEIVFKGNYFQNGESLPGGEYDHINNVECVYINFPYNGYYEIKVKGYNVPLGPQPYALVVTGALSLSDGILSIDREFLNCSDTFTVTVNDSDLVGNQYQEITIETDSQPEQSYILYEEPENSGIFSGTFHTVTTEPGENEVKVTDGDTLTVKYIDENNGHGGTNVVKTVSSLIDCEPAIISDVYVIDYDSNSVQIYWKTNELTDSEVQYGTTPRPEQSEYNSQMTTEHIVTLSGLNECTDYYFLVKVHDRANNITIDDNNGNLYTFKTLKIQYLINEPLNSNPEWQMTGNWEFGEVSGNCFDPENAFTGNYIIGYNLQGCYEDNMPAQYLITPIFDCTDAYQTYLSFYRYLSIEHSIYDKASIDISTDGGQNWESIWIHNGDTLIDEGWKKMSYNLSNYADEKDNVMLRWTIGPTDVSVNYGGWNLDDIKVYYKKTCDMPFLIHKSHQYYEETGILNRQMDYGEELDMNVYVKNLSEAATDVRTKIITLSPYIEIEQNESYYGDIGYGEIVGGNESYHLTVSNEAREGNTVEFIVMWQSNEGKSVFKFRDTIHSPILEIEDVEIVGDPDRDGVLDPGEIASIKVKLKNQGLTKAMELTGHLSSNSEYIDIIKPDSEFEDIESGEEGSTIEPHFQVHINSETPEFTTVTFTIQIEGYNGYTQTLSFNEVIKSSVRRKIFSCYLNRDPGWQADEGWEFGIPQGNCNDPTSGHTGDYVYGFNLDGCYDNFMDGRYLFFRGIRILGYFNLELRYWRWLNIEPYDFATITLWYWTPHHGSTEREIFREQNIHDTEWTEHILDISAADLRGEAGLRFGIRSWNEIGVNGGWNIDDIEIWGETYYPPPTPIFPTRTPFPPIATATPTLTPYISPTPFLSPTPSFSPTITSTPGLTMTPTPTKTPVLPSPTITPTEIITPTPLPYPILFQVLTNKDIFYPDDDFYLVTYTKNLTSHYFENVNKFIVLEYENNYWFYPDWSNSINFEEIEVPSYFEKLETILNFKIPTLPYDILNLTFYGLLTDENLEIFYSQLSRISIDIYSSK